MHMYISSPILTYLQLASVCMAWNVKLLVHANTKHDSRMYICVFFIFGPLSIRQNSKGVRHYQFRCRCRHTVYISVFPIAQIKVGITRQSLEVLGCQLIKRLKVNAIRKTGRVDLQFNYRTSYGSLPLPTQYSHSNFFYRYVWLCNSLASVEQSAATLH